MSPIRPQYHFRRTSTGIDAWDVVRLIRLASQLTPFHLDPNTIDELHENHWYFQGGVEPTPASIIEHCALIERADLSFPVILDSAGRVMDGMHRICKAVMCGEQAILAVQFERDPAPDFPDCDPAQLPYPSYES